MRLSPAPKPRLDPNSPSPHPSSSRSPVRGSARGLSPAKDLRKPSLTANILNDVNDAANAGILKKTISFPLKPRQQKAAETERPKSQPKPEGAESEGQVEETIGATTNDDTSDAKEEAANGTPATTRAAKVRAQTNGHTAMDSGIAVIEEEVAKKEDADAAETEIREATLSHVLTNVVILQEFVLELIAILQVRASLFQEVRFV